MALGEVIAQLVAVRGAIQTAMGLLADAGSEATEALGKAETALQGTAHELAEEGLSLWRRGETEGGFTVQKLAAADDALADYLEVLSPGSGGGRKNHDIARPNGEELLSRSNKTTGKSLWKSMIRQGDGSEDVVKEAGKHGKIWQAIANSDLRPPENTVESIQVPTGPVIKAPPRPQLDTGSVMMGAVVASLLVARGIEKAKGAAQAIKQRRGK